MAHPIRVRRSPTLRDGVDQVDANRIVIGASGDEEIPAGSGVDIYRLQVRALNQNDLHQPASDGRRWAMLVSSRRHPRRRSLNRAGRTGAGPQQPRRQAFMP